MTGPMSLKQCPPRDKFQFQIIVEKEGLHSKSTLHMSQAYGAYACVSKREAARSSLRDDTPTQ
jgi:hypothetical protein